MEQNANSSEIKDIGYEIFIALISILSVINMVLRWVPGVNQSTNTLIDIMNIGLTIIFVLDFVYRLSTSGSWTHYFFRNWGWADLLACVPQLRILRLFRIFKAYRIIHSLGLKKIITHLSDNRAETAIYILVFSVIIIIEMGAFFILLAENGSDTANIKSATDAIWWVYVTITTVGYGDHYPVTDTGKLIGIMVMTTGVGIFATFAGYIANKLLASKEKENQVQTDFDTEILLKTEKLFQIIENMERREREILTRIKKIEELLEEKCVD